MSSGVVLKVWSESWLLYTPYIRGSPRGRNGWQWDYGRMSKVLNQWFQGGLSVRLFGSVDCVAVLPTSSPWSESSNSSAATTSLYLFTNIIRFLLHFDRLPVDKSIKCRDSCHSDQSRRPIFRCMTYVVQNWIKQRAILMWRKLNGSSNKIDDTNDINTKEKKTANTPPHADGPKVSDSGESLSCTEIERKRNK
jgi:hypothetical protein